MGFDGLPRSGVQADGTSVPMVRSTDCPMTMRIER
jgi:hypothetical protein